MKSTKSAGRVRFMPVLALSLGFALAIVFSTGCRPSTGIRHDRATALVMTPQIAVLPPSSEKMGTGEVILIADARYPDIQFVKARDKYAAELEFSFALANKEQRQQVRLNDQRKTIYATTFAETLDRDKFARFVERMEVPVGEYTATIVGFDRNTVTPARSTQTVSVTDYHVDLTISKPLLFADSVTTFQLDKLMPSYRQDFDHDFFAFVIIGGLQPGGELTLRYDLQEAEGVKLHENTIRLPVQKPVTQLSLRVPISKLALGKTVLNIVAEHNGEEVETSRTIRYYPNRVWQATKVTSSLIDPMRCIMREKDWQALKKATPSERIELMKQFWQARNPNGEREKNPLLEEFIMRVEEANTRFPWGNLQGWQTDRGRIFIVYGPPDDIRYKIDSSRTMYEIWHYDEIGREFVFEDIHGDGDFKLISGMLS